MIAEYEVGPEKVSLTLISLEMGPVVTQAGSPSTLIGLPPTDHQLDGSLAGINLTEAPQPVNSSEIVDAPAPDSPTIDHPQSVGESPDANVSAEGPPSDPEGFESLLELVTEAANSVRELMTPCLTSHGLNDARFTIMRAIRGSTNAECSQSELARCLKQSEANVSTLLDRMRGDGLVSREKSPYDRRRSVVRLTEQGELQLKLTEQDYQVRSRGVLQAFNEFELQSFRNQLSSFIAIWETELEQNGSTNAVAGRIGENANDSNSENSETRHAQAG